VPQPEAVQHQNAAAGHARGKAARSRHAGSVDDKPGAGESRREEIGQRLAAIGTRMDELKAVRPDDASPAAVGERLVSAQRQAAASQAAAERAVAASVRAFRRAAEAHEHAALQYERAAAAGFGDQGQHERLAARHRAAAAADARRAEHAQAFLRDEEGQAEDQAGEMHGVPSAAGHDSDRGAQASTKEKLSFRTSAGA